MTFPDWRNPNTDGITDGLSPADKEQFTLELVELGESHPPGSQEFNMALIALVLQAEREERPTAASWRRFGRATFANIAAEGIERSFFDQAEDQFTEPDE